MEAKRSEWGFYLVDAVLLAAHGLVRKDPDVSKERVLGDLWGEQHWVWVSGRETWSGWGTGSQRLEVSGGAGNVGLR